MRASFFLLAVFLVGCATPRGVKMEKRPATDDFGPWSASESAPVVASSTHRGGGSNTGANDGLIDFVFQGYARTLTKVDGPRCNHRPTCSRYAFLAFKRHGYVVGSMLTIDRLLRGSKSSALRELGLYKIEAGTRYHFDPVSNNDFYFRSEDDDDH